MRRNLFAIALVVPFFAGCSGMNNTGKGALAGGGIGGLLGAGIGSVSGNAGAGAAIGGALGALTGGAVGSDMDRDERRSQAVAAHNAANPPMSKQDVIYMAQSHMSDDLIIGQIDRSNSAFQLSPQDVVFLRGQGVSERVIGYMQARRPAGPVAVQTVRPVYVVEERPPVAIGLGFSSGPRYYPHRRGCW